MPTYEYKCEKCGNFDEFQKITAPALTHCPTCGGSVQRVIGAPAVIFKGSGFYCTDNKSSTNLGSPNTDVNKDTTQQPESKTKTDSNTDSKAS